MNAAHKRGRALFLPKRPEMPAQCSTCPFLDTPAFKTVCEKLAVIAGQPPVTDKKVSAIRRRIKMEVSTMGDFFCHSSVYDASMVTRPAKDWKQCPGATRWFKGQ